MAVRSYDAKLVTGSFAGVAFSGLADGTFLSIEYNEDIYALLVGADGEATRSRSNNNSGRVTLTLLSTSPTNSALSALFQLDANTAGATGTGPLLIKDQSGSTVIAAEVAWITKIPTVEFGREGTSREWVFETDNLLMFAGGNGEDLQAEPVNLQNT